MGKDTGFKEFERQVPGYQPVDERIRHWQEFALPMAQAQVEDQAARCMNCGVPFCHTGCPLGNVIPDFNDHVYQGKWERALCTSGFASTSRRRFCFRSPCRTARSGSMPSSRGTALGLPAMPKAAAAEACR